MTLNVLLNLMPAAFIMLHKLVINFLIFLLQLFFSKVILGFFLCCCNNINCSKFIIKTCYDKKYFKDITILGNSLCFKSFSVIDTISSQEKSQGPVEIN